MEVVVFEHVKNMNTAARPVKPKALETKNADSSDNAELLEAKLCLFLCGEDEEVAVLSVIKDYIFTHFLPDGSIILTRLKTLGFKGHLQCIAPDKLGHTFSQFEF